MKRVFFAFVLVALVGAIGLALIVEVNGRSTVQQSATAQKKSAPRNLAIFIFDGVQIIDYTGPYEVFGQAHSGDEHLFNVYTVAEKPAPITTNMGMTVTPKYSFDNCPKPDIIVLPGGGVNAHMDNPKVIKWVQDTVRQSEYALSVCNGAFYLGKAGLLDGLSATTYYGLIDELKTLAPKARVVTDQRFVDNGKIITTAGLSSGIDGALHVVERIAGRGTAQSIALNMEYNWQPDVNYARASFADKYLRKVLGRQGFTLPEGTGWKVLGQEGGTINWEKNWEVRIESSASDLLKIIDTKLAEGWSKLNPGNSSDATRSLWKFTDEEGKTWNALASVQAMPGEKNAFKLTIKLARSDVAARLQIQ